MVSTYTNYFTGKRERVATFYPKGTMTKDAKRIYEVGMNRRYAPGGPGSSIRWLTYYLNRGGKNIAPHQRREIEKARRMLQKANKPKTSMRRSRRRSKSRRSRRRSKSRRSRRRSKSRRSRRRSKSRRSRRRSKSRRSRRRSKSRRSRRRSKSRRSRRRSKSRRSRRRSKSRRSRRQKDS